MPSCRFVLHEARATIGGEYNSTKLKEIARITEQITQDYSDVIVATTKQSEQVIRKKVQKGTVISSEAAKKMNLVGTINDEPYIKDMKGLAIFMINNPSIPVVQNNRPKPQKESTNVPSNIKPLNNKTQI